MNNDTTNTQPIFKPIFGAQWEALPPVLKRRYANRPYGSDEVVVEGILDVHVSKWMKFLSPFLRLCGALVPYAGHAIPVTVRFNSELDSNAVQFNRTFSFHDREPYPFQSKLVPFGDDKVVEFMRFGLGWRMRYHYEDGKAKLDHDGYIWRLFNVVIPLPFQWVLGKGYAYEEAISDDKFAMHFEIIHPLFGNVFGYRGNFAITKTP